MGYTGPREAALYQGLSDELKDLLLAYSPPEEWTPYTRLLRELDSKLRARAAEKESKVANPVPRPTAPTVPNVPQPTSAPATPASQRTTANGPTQSGPVSMDLPAARDGLNDSASTQNNGRLEYARAVACQAITEPNVPDITEPPAPHRSEPRKPRPDS